MTYQLTWHKLLQWLNHWNEQCVLQITEQSSQMSQWQRTNHTHHLHTAMLRSTAQKAVGWINEHFHKAILSDVSLCLFHHLYHERAASLYGWLMKVYVSPMGQTWWPSKLEGTFVVINSRSWGAIGEGIQKSGLLFSAFSSHGKGTYSVPFFPLSVTVTSNKTNLLHSVSEALFQAHLSSRV